MERDVFSDSLVVYACSIEWMKTDETLKSQEHSQGFTRDGGEATNFV